MLKISQIKGKSRWDELRGFLLRLVSLLRYFKVATDPKIQNSMNNFYQKCTDYSEIIL
jgi:aerobic-type carbon monoxide dehydrogenase small subunit (CoxS/CutS family)